ncbi:MAG TPA: GntR family transcriptional regulator [Actinomycetales bacterium]|nr:GntR family transcriptional regulator [Actinomycetales bacterium]
MTTYAREVPSEYNLRRGQVNRQPRSGRRPQTAQEVALVELRELILTGGVRPGQQLIQDAIANQLAISRVPVREALKILEGEGLVTYSPHHGYIVTKLTHEEILEVYRIRDLLEDEAAAKAVGLLTEEDFEAMARANEQLSAAYANGNLIDILWANREFHYILFRRGGTERLSKLIRIAWDSIEPYRSRYFADTEHHARQTAEHLEIIEAARAGDVERVLALSRAHRQQALNAIQDLVDENG